MTVAPEIELYELVELTQAIGVAPIGAKGGVIEFHGNDIALVEVTEPDIEDLDRLVFAPVSTLRPLER
jgi:hypothetical protein